MKPKNNPTQKFYRCTLCGRIDGIVYDGGGKLVCCGQPMTEIIPNSVDADTHTHLPIISVDGTTVTVNIGENPHSMSEDHQILWISLATRQGNQRKPLAPTDKPVAEFAITATDEVVGAYAYCNLHGLWFTKWEKTK